MVTACVCDYNSRAFSETLALAFHNFTHMPLLAIFRTEDAKNT